MDLQQISIVRTHLKNSAAARRFTVDITRNPAMPVEAQISQHKWIMKASRHDQ
jgi:hypothetical protein